MQLNFFSGTLFWVLFSRILYFFGFLPILSLSSIMATEAIYVDTLVTMWDEKQMLINSYRKKIHNALQVLTYSPELEEMVQQYHDAIWMTEKEQTFIKKRLMDFANVPRYRRFIHSTLNQDIVL